MTKLIEKYNLAKLCCQHYIKAFKKHNVNPHNCYIMGIWEQAETKTQYSIMIEFTEENKDAIWSKLLLHEIPAHGNTMLHEIPLDALRNFIKNFINVPIGEIKNENKCYD